MPSFFSAALQPSRPVFVCVRAVVPSHVEEGEGDDNLCLSSGAGRKNNSLQSWQGRV